MHLTPHLAQVQDQLAAAAALGDERTREIAASLGTAAAPAVRLAVLNALSAAADEITAALLDHPGSPTVSIRLDDDEVHINVQTTAEPAPPAEGRADDGDASARISLRLSEALKGDIDRAAARDGVSVNTWLVRAASAALQSNPFAALGAALGAKRGGWSEHGRVSGWING
jgi:hypothetical protein